MARSEVSGTHGMRRVTKQPQQPRTGQRTFGRSCAAMAFGAAWPCWVQKEPAFRCDCLLSVACSHIICYMLRH